MSKIMNLATQMIQNNPQINQSPFAQAPAYVVPNPNCCYNYGNFGFNNGSCCNSGCC